MTPIAGCSVGALPRRRNVPCLPSRPWLLLLLSVLMLSQGGGEGVALINCEGSCGGRGACRRVSAAQAGEGVYRCVCTDGYHGADCSRPPSPDLSRPAARQSPIRGGQSSWWLAVADRPRARHELESAYPIKREVEWRLPVGCDFSGFFVEVVCGYVPFLLRRGVRLALLHGRCSDDFLDRKLGGDEAAAYRQSQAEDNARSIGATHASIAIEHAEPCKMRGITAKSDLIRRPAYVISRSMSEGQLNAAEAACASERADEVWVPTSYHKQIFRASGVKSKISVVPEAVDVDFFDREQVWQIMCNGSDAQYPKRHGPTGPQRHHSGSCETFLPPPSDTELLSNSLPTWQQSHQAGWVRVGRGRKNRRAAHGWQPFVFLSVFKWEYRKGWDILLKGYWDEFGLGEDVVLRLRTFKPHWESGHTNIVNWLEDAAKARGDTLEDLARVEVVQQELSRRELRWLYASADTFVLPTRGEGWCLPAMEAMAMSLPVILTNATGPRAFITQQNALPLRFSAMHADGKVEPDVADLQRQMRWAFRNPLQAETKGSRARQDIVRKYHPDAVAALVEKRLKRIDRNLDVNGNTILTM